MAGEVQVLVPRQVAHGHAIHEPHGHGERALPGGAAVDALAAD